MMGQMQDWPLLLSRMIDHVERNHSEQEVVSKLAEGGEFRYTWGALVGRARQLAAALARLGVVEGDRLGTLAWNTHRHVEAWFAAIGMGAVAHTINPRLFPEQLSYIINHAEDKVILVDITFVPLLEALSDKLSGVRHFIIMTDRAHMPETGLPNVLCYEDLIAAEAADFVWKTVDEKAACGLCYTSGTTGNPKGVLYSHRSTFLHSLVTMSGDTLGISARDSILPVVPMFHANGWGVPYSAAAAGAKLVLNGPVHEADILHGYMEDEGVTSTAAVPTIWLGMLDYLRKSGKRLDTLKSVTIGGSAAPRTMIEAFEKEYDVRVQHAWGMTEMNPLGTVGSMNGHTATMPYDQQLDLKCKQGRPPIGVEMKITDDEGNELPRDGESAGHVMVRGPWVVQSYFKNEGGEILDEDGWFDTGDVANLDAYGFMQITDRSKDVIKSGGEWISSIDLENEAVGHPGVAEAAVIGIHHPKWDERPLLIIVGQDGQIPDKADMLNYLEGRIAKWWMPDDVVVVDEIPHTATGKILKTALRDQFRDYTLPTA